MALAALLTLPLSLGWRLFAWAAPVVLALVLAGYFLPHLAVSLLCRDRDLKAAYDAEWALVTGASSGIGKAIARKLASQELNVVLVALDDALLEATFAELRAEFPAVQVRKVGVNLGRPGYLEPIAAATHDVCVQLLFNNAGYMLSGFFESTSLEAQQTNLECNAVSAVVLTHHFLKRMIQARKRGGIVFTSSAAAAICSPFTSLYAGTKAFLSAFAAGLAVEVRHHGIDVLAVHPSPVDTRFYDGAQSLSVLDFFKARAVGPETLPAAVFGALGRTVWRDLGPDAVGFRLLTKLVDYNLLALVTSRLAPLLPDFQRAQAAAIAAKKRS